MNEYLSVIDSALDRLSNGIPASELKDARSWAEFMGYRFVWQIDPDDALDCMCSMQDNKGHVYREWFGGCAYTMTRKEQAGVESRLAWEQRQDTLAK